MNSTLILSGLALFATTMFASGCASTGTPDVAMGLAGEGYVCPLTGETLPCPKCCPLNSDEAAATTDAQTVSMAAVSSDGEGYTCPINGEMLPCEKCCPLNQE